ncbi:Hpt domain-containing protein [bacterium]|nr:Hpt domain-containing protein [bacterium]
MSEALNTAELQARLKGKKNRLLRLCAVFFQYYEQQINDIAAALEAGDAEALRMAAHTYKGTVSSFAAEPSQELSLRLETMGREQTLEGAQELLDQLRVQAQSLCARLRQLPEEDGWHES